MEKQCYELYRGIAGEYDVVLMRLPRENNRIVWLATLRGRIRKYLLLHPDITHVYFNDGLCGLAASAVREVSSAVTIVTLHGLDVVFPNKVYQKRLRENLVKNVDHIIPVSHATSDECIRRGVPKEKITVIPNGVDLDMGKQKKNSGFLRGLSEKLTVDLASKKILLSIGRSVERKGFSWFLEHVLPGLGDEYVYIMIGPRQKNLLFYNILFSCIPSFLSRQIARMGVGMDQNKIDALLNSRPLVKRAFHLGVLPHDDKVQLLMQAHAFVMPNIRVEGDAEGFGLVALEAVMCGAPVVASNLEGITEAIRDGKNGVLIEPENASAWTTAIERVPDPGAKRNKMTAAALEYTFQNYSWEKMVAHYKKVLANVE